MSGGGGPWGRGGAGAAGMLRGRWKRAALALLLLWGGVTYLVVSPLRCPGGGGGDGGGGGGGGGETGELEARLRAAGAQLHALREQHNTLLAQIRAAGVSGDIKSLSALTEIDVGPALEYETLRRRVRDNTRDLHHYASTHIAQALKEGATVERLQAMLTDLEDRNNVLLADQQRLRAADGHAAWRAREAAAVSSLVQRRLHALQNPKDCAAAKKVVCNLNKGCGFGCQLHHIAYCLIFAYATQRTLVLNSRGWRYHAAGWDSVFRPLSDSCTSYPTNNVQSHPAADAQVIALPFIDGLRPQPAFLPLAVPKDLGQRIERFNGDPSSWWVGQMLRYILRPRDHLAQTINATIQRINYRTPIVGVHIRRTDKVGTEAAFHHIHEYMRHVLRYWAVRDLARGVGSAGAGGAEREPRRVYLASDDPAVLDDARRKYPDVEFVGDAEIARGAATHRRYTPASLAGLLTDITLLARADFLVCTFSSQVGRVAYELMQANRPDAADAVQSLDDIYYFGGQNPHNRVALLAHDPSPSSPAAASQEIALKPGDLLGVAGNHWNGYGRGLNRRSGQNGLWPWYKTADHLVLYPFPTYPGVPLAAPTPGPAPAAGPDRGPAPAPADTAPGVDLANFLPAPREEM